MMALGTEAFARRAAIAAISVVSWLGTVTPAGAQGDQAAQDQEALAKASSNPVANIYSLPFQNNTSFNVGPFDATVNTLNIQPVIPVGIGKVNLINRLIIPIVSQGELVPTLGSEFGLGDISYTVWASPAAAGLFTYGIGPAFGIPTATSDRLGTGKWSAGPSVVVIALPGKWVVGVLASNTWSFAGDDDRADVNFFFSQFFVTYAIKNGWYLTSVPIITANWEAEGEKWTVPFGGGGGKLLKLGKLPVDV
jgi:hypothetical protein